MTWWTDGEFRGGGMKEYKPDTSIWARLNLHPLYVLVFLASLALCAMGVWL